MPITQRSTILAPKSFSTILLARKTNNQSISASTYESVNWNAIDLDVFGAFSGTTLTIPRTATYKISAAIRFTATGTTGKVETRIAISINGVIYLSDRNLSSDPIGSDFPSFVNPNLLLNQGDLIEIAGYASFTGGTGLIVSAGIQNALSIELLS